MSDSSRRFSGYLQTPDGSTKVVLALMTIALGAVSTMVLGGLSELRASIGDLKVDVSTVKVSTARQSEKLGAILHRVERLEEPQIEDAPRRRRRR